MTDATTKQIVTPPALDAIVDLVLRYRPKPKTKASKRRAKRAKRKAIPQRK
jgi:hypothetical protein